MRILAWSMVLCASMASAQSDTLTVLTYNVRYDNPADSADRWDVRKAALARVVMAEHPSVIGLQECLAHQLRYLDQQWPGYKRFGVGRDDGAAAGEFSPVYYDSARFSLGEARTIWLSPTPDTVSKGWDAACVRIATLVMLHDRKRGDSLCVVNTHWDHVGTEARLHSAGLILDLVAPAFTAGMPLVVMGDLNATSDEASVRDLAQYLVTTCPDERDREGTFNGFGRSVDTPRIDHVFISPIRWSVAEYAVLHPRHAGREVSDHFPVVVRLVR